MWTFHYNALGQPTYYDVPNGMTTNYTYDTKNRMTKIEYKDGTTVLDGFAYALDKVGNITKTTHEDDAYWDYTYDNRYRLLTANRFESGGNVKAAYGYTYDGGDSMLTKVEPFFDDFNDGNYTGWTISGTMSASNNMLESTGTGAPIASKSNTDASNEVTLRYNINNTSDSLTRCYIDFRWTDWNNYEWVRIFPNSIDIGKNASGTGTVLASGSATSTANVWYNLRIVADGANVKVYRWADGAMPTLVCSTTSSPNQSTSSFKISVQTGYLFDFDDVRVLADSLSNTTTFAVNNANELSSMSDYNGSTSFGFDNWGRMTNKSIGSSSAVYGYKYGQKLCAIDSSFASEFDATYKYGGDGRLKETIITGIITTLFRWDAGNTVVNEENSGHGLLRTHVGRFLGSIEGSDPSTGNPQYYAQDIRKSVHAAFDGSRTRLFAREWSPFGAEHTDVGTTTRVDVFAAIPGDGKSSFGYTPYRIYDPNAARWLTRDPLRMAAGVNMYAYVRNNPINAIDPFGLFPDPGNFEVSCPKTGEPNTQAGVIITFNAPDDSDCGKLDFIQIVKTDKNGIDFPQWHIDVREGHEDRFPYYPFPPTGSGKVAQMEDDPGAGFTGGLQSYETCAVCRKGNDKGKVYGCVTWSVSTSVGGRSKTYSGCGGNIEPSKPSDTFSDLTEGKF